LPEFPLYVSFPEANMQQREVLMSINETKSEWLTPKEVASAYPIGLSTLAKLRLKGGGAPYAKIGEKVLYKRSDLDAWLESKRVRSTSQHAA